MYGKNWAGETKRMLHVRRERHWLRCKHKHGYLDFSDHEREELKHYFNAMSDGNDRIGLQTLEVMLISLGLADNSKDVAKIVEKIDSSRDDELDFEEYLEIVRSRTDANLIQVFKAMVEGKLGDRNLNFQTVLSTYRRQLIMNATGARSQVPEHQEQGSRVLENFAALQRSRFREAAAIADSAEDLDLSASTIQALSLPFDSGRTEAAVGPLDMLWRSVCRENGLYSSRPSSADGKSRRTVEKPPSPESIIAAVVKELPGKRDRLQPGRTIIIHAPALDEEEPRH